MAAAGVRSLFGFWLGGAASSFPDTDEAAIIVAGVDRTNFIKKDTANFRRKFNQRSDFGAVFHDPNSTGFVPLCGQDVVVVLGSTRYFGGQIRRVNARRQYPSSIMEWDVTAGDYTIIADRRVLFYDGLLGVVEFPPNYAGATVRAMAGIGFSGEGIDLSLVEDGPFIVSPITEFFSTMAAALNRMTAVSGGYRWRIDEYKRLVFSRFASNPAPFTITYAGSTVPGTTWRKGECDRDLSLYRNEEYVRTESNILSTITETFTGDGVTRDFFIGLQDPPAANPQRWMASKPIITLDSGGGPVALTVATFGKDGLGTGYDCSYDADGVGIHFLAEAGQSAPPNGSTLSVQYAYTQGNVVTVADAVQIAARQAIEGGSGRHQAVVEQRNISDGTTLSQIGQGDLDQYGDGERIEFRYETDEAGLEPGQTQHVTLPEYDLDDDLIIDSIDTQWLNKTPFNFRHTLRLTNAGPINTAPQLIEKQADVMRIGVPRNSAVRTDLAGSGGSATFGGRQADGTSGNYLESETIVTTLDSRNGPWTISFWVKVLTLAQTTKVVVQYSDLPGLKQVRFDYNFTASGNQLALFAVGYSGADPSAGSGIVIPDTGWHHVAWRKDGAASSAYYKFLDGVPTLINAGINFTFAFNMQYAFAFADRENQFSPTRNFNGAIAEIAVWPTLALTDAQIVQLAARVPANVVFSGGLEDYWPIGGSLSPEPNLGGNTTALDVHGTLPPA